MTSERQIEFRREYRSRILGWYDGYIHVLIIYAMGAAGFYIYVEHIHDVRWLEWITVPFTFVFTNLFEWGVHKYVMHRPVNIKGLRSIYERHTLNHHQFFSDEEMRFRDHDRVARAEAPHGAGRECLRRAGDAGRGDPDRKVYDLPRRAPTPRSPGKS